MAVPTVPTFTPGVLASSTLNALGDALRFAIDPPSAIATRTGAAQSVPNATFTAITLDTEVADNDGLWDSGSPTVLTMSEDGLWLAGGHLLFASNATGYRQADLQRNATTFETSDVKAAVSGVATSVHATGLLLLAASDTLRILAYQTSGGALNTWATDRFPRLWATRQSGA
ncbi:MAG TPA: hypothetical protein VFM54_16680 [Micromonosporaceae bacterium]|nr:hypothetical protein [Micromonosporaceae bacterium]